MSGRPPGYDERLSRATAELARLERRLRSLSATAQVPRQTAVMVALAQLADISSAAAGRAPQALPPVADHAFADALLVLGGDVLEGLAVRPDDATLTAVIELFEEALDATR